VTTLQFQVRQDDLARTRVLTLPDAALADGEIRVRVDHFGFSSNNITYAAFGQAMHYWDFFPAAVDAGDDARWGVVPVWGFGDVVQSAHPGVAIGERLYGYWPMASQAVLQPTRLSPGGFSDGMPHRQALHAVYNQLSRCAADPFHTPDTEAQQALLRPLFLTAWLLDDFLADNHFFGTTAAGQRGVMLLSSASSKTAYATAARLALRPEVEVVGLTSTANLDFCRSLGCYAQVLPYDALDTLPADGPLVYVDFAGNGSLRQAVHQRFERLAYSCSIGGTHVDQLAGARDLPGPRPTLFFAPAQAKKRAADWGAADFNQRLVAAWRAFLAQAGQATPPWLQVQSHAGAAAVTAVYAQVLAGRGDPRVGHMLSLSR
jgi:Protein of unknown function (DUF2855)